MNAFRRSSVGGCLLATFLIDKDSSIPGAGRYAADTSAVVQDEMRHRLEKAVVAYGHAASLGPVERR